MYVYSLSTFWQPKKREFKQKFASYLYQATEPEKFVCGKGEKKRRKKHDKPEWVSLSAYACQNDEVITSSPQEKHFMQKKIFFLFDSRFILKRNSIIIVIRFVSLDLAIH